MFHNGEEEDISGGVTNSLACREIGGGGAFDCFSKVLVIHHQKLVEGEEEEEEKKEEDGKRTSPLEHNKVTSAVHHDEALDTVQLTRLNHFPVL